MVLDCNRFGLFYFKTFFLSHSFIEVIFKHCCFSSITAQVCWFICIWKLVQPHASQRSKASPKAWVIFLCFCTVSFTASRAWISGGIVPMNPCTRFTYQWHHEPCHLSSLSLGALISGRVSYLISLVKVEDRGFPPWIRKLADVPAQIRLASSAPWGRWAPSWQPIASAIVFVLLCWPSKNIIHSCACLNLGTPSLSICNADKKESEGEEQMRSHGRHRPNCPIQTTRCCRPSPTWPELPQPATTWSAQLSNNSFFTYNAKTF